MTTFPIIKTYQINMKKLAGIFLFSFLASCTDVRIEPAAPQPAHVVNSIWRIDYAPGVYKTIEFLDSTHVNIVLVESYSIINNEVLPYEFKAPDLTVYGIFEVPFSGTVDGKILMFQAEKFIKIYGE